MFCYLENDDFFKMTTKTISVLLKIAFIKTLSDMFQKSLIMADLGVSEIVEGSICIFIFCCFYLVFIDCLKWSVYVVDVA